MAYNICWYKHSLTLLHTYFHFSPCSSMSFFPFGSHACKLLVTGFLFILQEKSLICSSGHGTHTCYTSADDKWLWQEMEEQTCMLMALPYTVINIQIFFGFSFLPTPCPCMSTCAFIKLCIHIPKWEDMHIMRSMQ